MNEVLEIKEEFLIPGTSIILEAGDKIQVLEAVSVDEIEKWLNYEGRSVYSDALDSGYDPEEEVYTELNMQFKNSLPEENSYRYLMQDFFSRMRDIYK